MKCIKENCKYRHISQHMGFCEVLDTFVFGEDAYCLVSDKIVQLENELREYNSILDKVIVYHERNREVVE